jgi:hypothetical protein
MIMVSSLRPPGTQKGTNRALVAPWDEMDPRGEYCGTCGAQISEPEDEEEEEDESQFPAETCIACGRSWKGECPVETARNSATCNAWID